MNTSICPHIKLFLGLPLDAGSHLCNKNLNRDQKMLRASTFSPSTSLYAAQSPAAPFITSLFPPRSSSSPVGLPLTCLRLRLSPLRSFATQEIVKTNSVAHSFVDVGFVSSVHGLQGEICVKPSTDFPELRFCNPGKRWLRQQVSSKEKVKEVELIEGREHHGQKSWILKLEGIDTVDQARELVGSTLLAREEDRPLLEEGEFYTRDLVGMKVLLKETSTIVGTVVNVFDSGANDLLHVKLEPPVLPDGSENSNSTGNGASGNLIWIPFVESIVPNVDLTRKEMLITPPKGLLELNLKSDERSKKERRQLEWKERKKHQKRLIAAKKKLCELDQQHIFHGLRFGEKSQRSLLAAQILGVNSKLFQRALKTIEVTRERWNILESIAQTKLAQNRLRVSEKCLASCSSEKVDTCSSLHKRSCHLLAKGKVAIVLHLSNIDNELRPTSEGSESSPSSLFQALFGVGASFVKVDAEQAEHREHVPLFLVCPTGEVQSIEKLFSSNDYFGFDPEKILFLEEEKLPVLSHSLEQNMPKILMKSPWEILQSPVGSGGILSLLSSDDILEPLNQSGVQYIQICSANASLSGGSLVLLGYVESQKADIGIQIPGNDNAPREGFNVALSMDFMKVLSREIGKLKFQAIPKANPHVEMVEKEWVESAPSVPNSYELSSTIYSCLDFCPMDQVCVMVTE